MMSSFSKLNIAIFGKLKVNYEVWSVLKNVLM